MPDHMQCTCHGLLTVLAINAGGFNKFLGRAYELPQGETVLSTFGEPFGTYVQSSAQCANRFCPITWLVLWSDLVRRPMHTCRHICDLQQIRDASLDADPFKNSVNFLVSMLLLVCPAMMFCHQWEPEPSKQSHTSVLFCILLLLQVADG